MIEYRKQIFFLATTKYNTNKCVDKIANREGAEVGLKYYANN